MISLSSISVRAVILLLCGMGLAGLTVVSVLAVVLLTDAAGKFDSTVNETLDRARSLDEMEYAVSRIGRAAMIIALTDEAHVRSEQSAIIAQFRRAYDASWAKIVSTSPPSPEIARKREAIVKAAASGSAATAEFLSIHAAGDESSARAILVNRVIPEHRAWFSALEENSAARWEEADDEVAATLAVARSAAGWITVVATTVLIASLLLSWRVERFLRHQLGGEPRDLANLANQVALGNLDVTIHVKPGDTTSVVASAERMRNRLREVVLAQREMIDRHRSGEVSFRVSEESQSGSFQEMARGTNELAELHINVSRHVLEIIGDYAIGKFSRDIDRLPGEQGRITDTVNAAKVNLTLMKDETIRLAGAASRGDFALRGESARFSHSFSEIIEGLNSLMENADRGISDISHVLAKLASGVLTSEMRGDHVGAFAHLRDSARTTARNLTLIVDEIKGAAESINDAAEEISSANVDLSARSEQQAGNLAEAAAALEALTDTVAQNARNAKRASDFANSAGLIAAAVGEVMGQVDRTMGQITASSARIGQIISVIDGIAFQTNILALNAAVEAARAGEHGLGFAVVSGEIRALALRSSSAAREIKEIVRDSGECVDTGAVLVKRAGVTTSELAGAVKHIGGLLLEISDASAEQTRGIEQINGAISQVDQNTQRNVALVEEATAVAHGLQGQAAALTRSVSAFVHEPGFAG